MPRCGCTGGSCACLIQGVELDCINVGVSGLGSSDLPYKIWATPVIDPDAENLLECGPDGLLVLAGDELVGGNTDCVSVSVTGGAIFADLILDPDPDNFLSCGPSGLIATGSAGTFFDVLDTDCVSLAITGTGSEADPFELSAELVIHPDYLDCLSCSPSGLQLVLDAATLECSASGLTVVGGGGGSADETLFWTLAGGI